MSVRNHGAEFPTAVDTIVNFVKPKKQRALRRYLGMVNYYHRFIHCAVKLMLLYTVLTEANEEQTRLSPKSNFDLNWTENANSVFIESQQMLAYVTLLGLNITCDASDFSAGGVLQNVWIIFGNRCHFSVKSYPRSDTLQCF